jgi:hypothetical protein
MHVNYNDKTGFCYKTQQDPFYPQPNLNNAIQWSCLSIDMRKTDVSYQQ